MSLDTLAEALSTPPTEILEELDQTIGRLKAREEEMLARAQAYI